MFATIQSNNIVGYQDKALDGANHFNFVVPTFDKVDGTTIYLSDITLKYSELNPAGQMVWTLTLGGATKQSYYYVNEAVAEDWDEKDAVGWYTDMDCTIPAENIEIPYGQGFALVTAEDSTKVIFSGAVYSGEVAVDIKGGNIFNFTGNCLPIGCKLNDLAFIYTELNPAGQMLWTLTMGGATKQSYYYVNEAVANDWDEKDAVGWYTDMDCTIPAENFELPAGQGIAVVSAEPIQLLVPAAITK